MNSFLSRAFTATIAEIGPAEAEFATAAHRMCYGRLLWRGNSTGLDCRGRGSRSNLPCADGILRFPREGSLGGNCALLRACHCG